MALVNLTYLTAVDRPLTKEEWKSIKYFRPDEFSCKCVEHKNIPVYDMSSLLIYQLIRLRELINIPILITSGYRCEQYNAQIGGEPNSAHIHKVAADITISNPTFERLRDLYLACEHIGFRGLGFYPARKIIHVDVMNRIQRWLCNKEGKYIYFLVGE
jgi:uncharacterized protein YcbK (DUF882 family)